MTRVEIVKTGDQVLVGKGQVLLVWHCCIKRSYGPLIRVGGTYGERRRRLTRANLVTCEEWVNDTKITWRWLNATVPLNHVNPVQCHVERLVKRHGLSEIIFERKGELETAW